ncbi:hypothetical protein ODJ79_01135 [Actinoplanes sp. KI2]|uniref:hypothetical protein n=1 Tax=Actinoplanes sp. KI2 TaxID=2983315 RepID=UPI0021D59E99|nr:hypothetical protein [Actinoplanes sp. KI2]MCU7722312.1 hypothetical protein [Actinoplanes sp. KI2]
MILTVLVLVPSAVLFGRVWQETSRQTAQTDLEKKGVEYLTALTPLISALAEAQSSAVQGVTAPPDSLTAAVAKAAAADAKLGDDLKTRERWTDLNSKIAKLAKATGGPLAVLQSHIEVSDLALELYGAIRRNSQLNRDPASDMNNLQQAVAIDMPTTVVRVSRMGDWANIAQTATGNTRATITVQFGEEALAVQDSVTALTEDLQAAVDDTTSPTLSGALVTTLDSFRRGVESMTRGANQGGTPNVATMSTAQTALQTALNALANVTLKEMAKLLEDRSDSLAYRRTEAVVMGLLAIALVLAALIWPVLGRRRGSQPTGRPIGEGTRDIPAATIPAPGGYGGQYEVAPAYGDIDPTRRERSGALR